VSSTSAIFRPTKRLNSVDLPTFGRLAHRGLGRSRLDRSGRCLGSGLVHGAGRAKRNELRDVNLHALADVLPGKRIGKDRLERRHGGVEIAGLVLGEPDRFARGVAHRVALDGEPADALLHSGDVAVVNEERRGERQREIAQPRVGLGGRKRIVGGDRFGSLAVLGEEPRLAEPRERGVAARALCRDVVERRLCTGDVAGLSEFERSVELIGGAGGVGVLPPLPAFVGGNDENDRDSRADDVGAEALPDGAQAITAQLLVDFAEDGFVGHRRL
jgi:hypothetical protein